MTGQNPSPREVFDDLAAEHLNQPTGRRRSMFGRDCLTTGGAMVAFFHRDHLALKLPPDRAAAMITSGEGVTPEMGDRAMRRWLAVPLPEGPNAHQRCASCWPTRAPTPGEPTSSSGRPPRSASPPWSTCSPVSPA